METTYAKYMRYGKQVKNETTGDTYKLIEDMNADSPTVKAVHMRNFNQYDTLGAWERNWEQNSMGFRERFVQSGKDIEECKIERQSYEEDINIADIVPHDKVRFITPQYETLFEVVDLGKVSVDGKEATVTFLDETHFSFIDTFGMNLHGGCLHICQFAEICEKEGIEVKPVGVPPIREVYVEIGTEVVDRVPVEYIEYKDFWDTHKADEGYTLVYLDSNNQVVQ